MPLITERLRHCHSEIGLAEYLDVIKHLKPTDPSIRAVMLFFLGLSSPVEVMHKERSETGEGAATASRFRDADFQDERNTPDIDSSIAPQPSNALPAGVQMLKPERKDPITVELLVGRSLATSTAALAHDRSVHLRPPPSVPLIHPRWFRGVARAMLATLEPTTEIDWSYVEKRVLAGRPIDRAPWRNKLTFRRGVQVLLDHSESMQPFRRDCLDLVQRLQRLLGPTSVRSRYFRLNPWGSPGNRFAWLSRGLGNYCTKTPVLIVSDFGISQGRVAEPEIWQDLLREAHALQCPTLALVPAPQISWPTWLTRVIPRVLTWDRETSPQSARRSRSSRPC